MKKLLCIAFFSIAIMASTTAKKETMTINSKEVIKIANNDLKTSEIEIAKEILLMSCSEKGNLAYALNIEAGFTHREARSFRRDVVRGCRGGTWMWLKRPFVSESGLTL